MPKDEEAAAPEASDTDEDQLKALIAEKELLQEEKDRLAEENAALAAENEEMKVNAEADEPTYEDWKDDDFVIPNPRSLPIPPKGDWANCRWKPERMNGKKMVALVGKRPRGSKKFFWNRDPTKLVIKEIDMDEVVELHVKGGPVRLVFGDVVELTPDLIQRMRPYIVDGSLGPRRTNPVRRSIKTSKIVVEKAV